MTRERKEKNQPYVTSLTDDPVPGRSRLNDVVDVSSDGGGERVPEFLDGFTFLLLRALAWKQKQGR